MEQRFVVLNHDDLKSRLGDNHPSAWMWKQTYGNYDCWYLLDTKTNEIVGYDGGEPEDQLLLRDWKWVPEALNALEKERAALEAEMESVRGQERARIAASLAFMVAEVRALRPAIPVLEALELASQRVARGWNP